MRPFYFTGDHKMVKRVLVGWQHCLLRHFRVADCHDMVPLEPQCWKYVIFYLLYHFLTFLKLSLQIGTPFACCDLWRICWIRIIILNLSVLDKRICISPEDDLMVREFLSQLVENLFQYFYLDFILCLFRTQMRWDENIIVDD